MFSPDGNSLAFSTDREGPYDLVLRRLDGSAADRTLWGTDFPHPNATHEADEADLVDLVPKFAPDPAVQKLLLVDNPAKLYGFN